MSAHDEVALHLSEIGPLRELAAEVRDYPVRLLRLLCATYAERGGPVPDHALKLAPYLGETALRALVEGGLAEEHEVSYAVKAFTPTQAALDLVARLDGASPAPGKPGATRGRGKSRGAS